MYTRQISTSKISYENQNNSTRQIFESSHLLSFKVEVFKNFALITGKQKIKAKFIKFIKYVIIIKLTLGKFQAR